MTYVPKILSGIDLIDKSWGGLYQGGSYMCYGHASSGRGLLGMMFLQTGVLLEEKGLFISPGRPHDWMIQASSVNFDLQKARDNGKVRILWIPSASSGPVPQGPDVSRVIEELIRIIQAEKPSRILINDFSPFLRFSAFEQFQRSFTHLMSKLDEFTDTTVVLMMPAAVNKQSKHIIDFMSNHMTGSIHISLEPKGGSENKRRLALLPGIGHIHHDVYEHWEIPSNQRNMEAEMLHMHPSDGQQPVGSDLFLTGSLAHVEEVSTVRNELAVPSFALESIRKVELENAAFCKKLKSLFQGRTRSAHKHFVLLALRLESEKVDMDPDIVFDMLLTVILEMVEQKEHVLVDLERHRVIAFITNVEADSVKQIFESLKHTLKKQYPELADRLPHAISAIVVPDGQPFELPEDFLAYALEGN